MVSPPATPTPDTASPPGGSDIATEAEQQADATQQAVLPKDELLQVAIGSTVRVSSDTMTGSGVVLGQRDQKLYVLTVCHAAVQGIEQIDCFSLESTKFPGPQWVLGDVEVVTKSESADLAVICASVPGDAEFRSVSLVKNLDSSPETAYSVGCSVDGPPTLLAEKILRAKTFVIRDKAVKRYMWETEKPQRAGRSGGPLLDAQGRLIGLALGQSSGKSGFYSHCKEIVGYLIDSNLGWLVN